MLYASDSDNNIAWWSTFD